MSKLAKAAIGIMGLTVFSKVLGFGRELVLASAYGANAFTDAYLISFNIPNTLFAIIGTAIATTFIPIYYEVDRDLGREKSLVFTNNVFNIVLLISFILAILGTIFTPQLVKIFAMGFEGEVLQNAISQTKIFIWGILFIGISNLSMSYLEAHNIFTMKGLIGIPLNLIVITSIILSLKFGPNVFIYGSLLGIASQAIIQIPFIIKNGYRFKPYIDLKDKYIKKIIVLTGPVIIGVGISQINELIDRTLASTLAEGSITALNYANKLNSFILALFIASITTVIYPRLSKMSNQNDKSEFVKIINKSINIVILIIIPIIAGAIVFAVPIVQILFQRGMFDSYATRATASALVFYSIGMIGFGVRDVLLRGYYSLQDTKTPMVNSTIGIIVNIILNIILVRVLAHKGLALATSISAIVTAYLLHYNLKRKMPEYKNNNIPITIIKSLISAIIMSVISYLLYKGIILSIGATIINQVIGLALAVLGGIVAYSLCLLCLKTDEIYYTIDIIKSKIKNN